MINFNFVLESVSVFVCKAYRICSPQWCALGTKIRGDAFTLALSIFLITFTEISYSASSISVSASASPASLQAGQVETITAIITASQNIVNSTVTFLVTFNGVTVTSKSYTGQSFTPNNPFTKMFAWTSPTNAAVGTYLVTISVAKNNILYGKGTASFAIIPPPIAGVCGIANGANMVAMPAAYLCSVGTASAISGSGPWNWSCAGINNGASVSCSAPLGPAQAGEMLTGDTNRPSISTFKMGEPLQLIFRITEMAPSQKVLLNLKTSDEFGNVFSTLAQSVYSDASGTVNTVSISVPSDKYGYFKVDANLSDGAAILALGTRPPGFITYAVVPDPATRTAYAQNLSRFGMQGQFWTIVNSGGVNPLPYLGVRWAFDNWSWSGLEPNYSGEFADTRATLVAQGYAYPGYDSGINNLTFAGNVYPTYDINAFTRAAIPVWAQGADAVPADGSNFFSLNTAGQTGITSYASAYAQAFVANFPSQAQRYYQITWEPQITPPSPSYISMMTASELMQYYVNTYAVLHSNDPNAVVAGPTMFLDDVAAHGTGQSQQMNELLALGFANYIDVYSVHPYCSVFPAEPETWLSSLRSIRSSINSAAGRVVPFIGTEHGYALTDLGIGNDLNKALGDIRMTLMLLGEGASYDISFYLNDVAITPGQSTTDGRGFYWDLDTSFTINGVSIAGGTDKIGPKPIMPAYAAMTYILDGAISAGPILGLTGSQMGYRFQRGTTTILVLWDYAAASSTASFSVPPGGMQICNWMNNCRSITNGGNMNVSLGPSPIYLIGQGL